MHQLQSFFIGGRECSSHRRPNGRRLDLIAATHHDQTAQQDCSLLRANGIGQREIFSPEHSARAAAG